MDKQEKDIIKKIGSRDKSGLHLLFDLYYSPLCVFACKYLDSFEKAEDVVQEVFITLWEKNRMKNFTGSIKSYLFNAVRNNSIHKVKEERKFRFEDVENKSYAIIEDKFEPYTLEERKAKLYKEIEQLPIQSKKVFEAIVFERMKYAEIAAELNISINTVKTHYSRALKQLRNSIDIIIVMFI